MTRLLGDLRAYTKTQALLALAEAQREIASVLRMLGCTVLAEDATSFAIVIENTGAKLRAAEHEERRVRQVMGGES